MMRILKLPFMIAVLSMLMLGSCTEDWGQQDPPAGTDVYPILERVVKYDFESADGVDPLDPAVFTLMVTTGDIPSLAEDEVKTGQVLNLNGGYARLSNPMLASSAQDAVSLTFWVKQQSEEQWYAQHPDAEEGSFTKDLNSALFSFQSIDGQQKMYFTGNGELYYHNVDGECDLNAAPTTTTGMLDAPGDWHFVAVCVHNEGYFVYVDGNKRIDQTVKYPNFANVVQFMANAPYLYIGSGADTECRPFVIDDITVYRNKITAKEWTSTIGGGSETEVNKHYIEFGTEACDAAFWTVFSDTYALKDGQTLHLGFWNFTAGGNNWENWLLVCTNNGGGSGSPENFVLRADAFGWGDKHVAENITSDYNWDTFLQEINGAWIDLTVTKQNGTVTVKAVTTSADGSAVRTMNYKCEGCTEAESGFFLTLEKAYLKLDPEQCYVGSKFEPGTYLVGAADCSAGWWTAFSEAYDFDGNISEDNPFVLHFINNNTGAGSNWNNWLLVCTQGGGPGNPENFVLRSDAFGWGTVYDMGTGVMVQSFNWDTYVADMHGAECWVGISRNGSTFKMDARQRTAAGVFLPEYTYTVDGVDGKMGVFLTAELASLDILDVAYYPYFKYISVTE